MSLLIPARETPNQLGHVLIIPSKFARVFDFKKGSGGILYTLLWKLNKKEEGDRRHSDFFPRITT